MIMLLKNTRSLYLLTFLGVTAILSYGFYLQYVEGVEPCPLCILQRISFGAAGLFALLGFLSYRCKYSRLFSSFFGLLFSLAGLGLALRQTWIQLHPSDAMTECGVSLQYMLQALPLHEVAYKIFAGSAECTQRTWEFLTLSMAEWSAICFALLTIIMLTLLKRFKQV